jgi:hypothetical protein
MGPGIFTKYAKPVIGILAAIIVVVLIVVAIVS